MAALLRRKLSDAQGIVREWQRDGDRLRRVAACLLLGVVYLVVVLMVGNSTGLQHHSLLISKEGKSLARYTAVATLDGQTGRVTVSEELRYAVSKGLARGGRRVIPYDVSDVAIRANNPAGLRYRITSPARRQAEGRTEIAWEGIHLPAPLVYNISLTYTLPDLPVVLAGSDPSRLPLVPPAGYLVYTAIYPRRALPSSAAFFDVVLRLPFAVRNATSGVDDPQQGLAEEVRWNGTDLADPPEGSTAFPSVLMYPFAAEQGGVLETNTYLVDTWTESRYVGLWGDNVAAAPQNRTDVAVVMASSHDTVLPTGLIVLTVILLVCCVLLLCAVLLKYPGRLGLVGQTAELRIARERAVILIQSLFRGALTRRRFANALFTIKERSRLRKSLQGGGTVAQPVAGAAASHALEAQAAGSTAPLVGIKV